MCASFAKQIRVNNFVTPEFFYMFQNDGKKNDSRYEFKPNGTNGINNFAFERFLEYAYIPLLSNTLLQDFT